MASPKTRQFVIDWDTAMDADLAAVVAAQDAVFSAVAAMTVTEFWPGSEIEPFATFIDGVAKYVASSTPLGRQWRDASDRRQIIHSCRTSRMVRR